MTIIYIYAETNINEKLVELEVIFLRDFTVQGQIDPAIWQNFVSNHFDDVTCILAFKESLTARLREVLQTECGLEHEETQIFSLNFSFNNKSMLKLLRKRALALGDADFEKVQKVERKMDLLKESKFNDLRTPNRFYCTFNELQAGQALQNLGKFTFKN